MRVDYFKNTRRAIVRKGNKRGGINLCVVFGSHYQGNICSRCVFWKDQCVSPKYLIMSRACHILLENPEIQKELKQGNYKFVIPVMRLYGKSGH